MFKLPKVSCFSLINQIKPGGVAVLLYVLKVLQTIQQDLDSFGQACQTVKTLKALYCDLMAKIPQESRYEKDLSTHKSCHYFGETSCVHRTLKLVYISINETQFQANSHP